MPDSLMYQENHFVMLETAQPEQFLTAAEMLEKLRSVLSQHQDSLPRDLQSLPTIQAQAKYLLDTACELDVGSGDYLQWYAVRLEK